MKRKPYFHTIVAASSLLAPTSIFAASGNWNVDNLGNWSLATNWSSNPTVPGTAAGDIVSLSNNITANRTVTIDTTSRTVGTLNIGDSNNSHAFTLATSGGATLTFNNSGSGASIVESAATSAFINDSITATVILADNLSVNAAGSLRMTGNISESGGARSLTKSGDGLLVLGGTNSYTGGSSVTAGTLSFRTIAAKSTTGTHTFNAGTTLGLGIGTGGFTATDIQNAFAGTFTGNLSGISIGSSNNIAIDTTSAGATFSANIGPSTRGLVKIFGGANLTLTGANQYSGRTVVDGGSGMVVNSLGNIADTSSNIGTNSTIDMREASRIDISTASSSDKHFNILGNATIFPQTGTFTHTGNISTETAGAKTVTLSTNDTSLINVKDFQGVISDGSGTIAVTKGVNAGNIWLSGNNSYTGATSVVAGNLIIGHANALGGTAAGTTVSNGATLGLRSGITTANEALTLTPGTSTNAMLSNFSGNNTWSDSITSNTGTATNTSRIGSDADKLSVNGTVSITGSAHEFILQGAGAIELAGQVTGVGIVTSATNGTGVRKLSNDTNNYTGNTRVNGGTLEFTSVGNVGGGASSLGAPTTVASGTINLGFDTTAATLRYVGTAGVGHSSDRVINLAGTTGTYNIEANGTGPLVLTSGLTGTGSGTKTLVLGGTNTGNNSIAAIPNGASGTVSVTKSGTGTWILSATNSYTGATNVNAGKLVVNGNISTSNLTTVAPGATLAGNGSVGKTVINGTLSVGNSPGIMTFTDTLTLAGTTLTDIDGNAGAGVTGGHDFVNLTGIGAAGLLTYGGTMTLDIGTTFGVGTYSWNLFDMASETGTFTSITLADQYFGSLLDADLNGVWDLVSGSNTWQFTESTGVLGLTVIPEPRAALLGGLGLLMLLRRRRA
jgi:autotransporter-associated beta strand protein